MEEKRKAEETFQSTLPIQGETCMGSGGKTIILHFNPLSLYRERRHLIRHHKHSYSISIHSPYTGRDHLFSQLRLKDVISIHSPYTGRDTGKPELMVTKIVFQSTLPIQGETANKFAVELLIPFQSTLPIQGETVWRTSSKKSRKISIHSPYTGRDE